MHNFLTFMGKELTENLRTKKVLVLGCVFLLFAISSPLLARFLGEFLNLLLPADDEMGHMLADLLGNPVWQESFLQYYSNLAQIGIMALLFMYMTSIQREIKTGTASLMFSKGLGFMPFVLAKFAIGSIVVVVATMVSTLVAYIYTLLLFDYAGQIVHVMLGGLVFSLGAMMFLAIVLWCSTLSKSVGAVAGLGAAFYFGFAIASAIPRIGAYVPSNLLTFAIPITEGHFPDTFAANIMIALAVMVVSLLLATHSLKRAEG